VQINHKVSLNAPKSDSAHKPLNNLFFSWSDSDDYTKSQKRHHPSTSNSTLQAVSALENDLGYLQDSWASIHIVLDSLQNAFLVTPFQSANEQQLDELDRELGTAYDDLMIQVRQLDRALKQLDRKIIALQDTFSQVDR
jgi:hypothetical protein